MVNSTSIKSTCGYSCLFSVPLVVAINKIDRPQADIVSTIDFATTITCTFILYAHQKSPFHDLNDKQHLASIVLLH